MSMSHFGISCDFITFGSCLSHFGTIPPMGPVSCGDILFQNWSLGEDPPVIPLLIFPYNHYIITIYLYSCPLFSMIFHDFPWCIPMIFKNHFIRVFSPISFPGRPVAPLPIPGCQVNASPFQLIWADDAAFLRMESNPAQFRYAVRPRGSLGSLGSVHRKFGDGEELEGMVNE